MEKIISCINKKGGCAKTTTLMALADGLAIRGKRILVVDLDSQMNMSIGYGNFHLSDHSIYDVLCNKGFDINDAIYRVPQDYFGELDIKGSIDIIPANAYVDRLQKELDGMMRKEERLLRSLQKLDPNKWDYILIDTAPLPVTDIVITNVMVASDEILVPTKLELFSSTGVELILPRIEQLVEEEINPDLKINGILCTQVIGRRKNTNGGVYQSLLEYANAKGIRVYDTYIRNLEGVVSSQINRKSLFVPKTYVRKVTKKDGTVVEKTLSAQTEIAKDYNGFINEFLGKGDKNE